MTVKKNTMRQSNQLRKHRLLATILSLACLYFAVSAITIQFKIYSRQQTLDDINISIEQQQEQNDELGRLISGGKDSSEYIEKIAREKLGYAAADERVFVDIAGIEN